MKRAVFPFRIVGIHTRRHGTAYGPHGLTLQPEFGPPAASTADFLSNTNADVAIEITTLNPHTGEPAISHIRAALGLGMHVITANKGPIAFAYSEVRDLAERAQLQFRFESTVMDGTPVFNNLRNNLPGLQILAFAGVLNSTSQIVLEAMENGKSMEDGLKEAQARGIAEADASFDLDGWDSAAKTAALANVFLDAQTTPHAIERSGLGNCAPGQLSALRKSGKTVRLVSRASRQPDGSVRLRVAPETLDRTDVLATGCGSTNVLLLHTDLMGAIATVSIEPAVEQTAYGLFSDLVDIAKSV